MSVSTGAAVSLGATVMRSAVEEVFWYVSTRSFSGMVRVLPAAERSAWYSVKGAMRLGVVSSCAAVVKRSL